MSRSEAFSLDIANEHHCALGNERPNITHVYSRNLGVGQVRVMSEIVRCTVPCFPILRITLVSVRLRQENSFRSILLSSD